MNISLVIVTHDIKEIMILQRKDLLNHFSEIIIVNTGLKSNSKFPEKVKIYEHEFKNYFSELKNYALSKVTCDWIFTLDTDEIVSAELVNMLGTLIKDPVLEGYWFRRKTYLSANSYLKHGVFYPDYQLRLFKNKKEYRYQYRVHEVLKIPKEKTKEILYDILHYPTNPKYESFSNFMNFSSYIKIGAREFLGKKYSVFKYLFIGLQQFCTIFFGGFFRGKGFLDGWAGLRAHLIFATSIACSYWLAGYWKLIGKK